MRGALVIFVLVGLVALFYSFFGEDLDVLRCYFLTNVYFVYLGFVCSEILGSLFPPEIFILALGHDNLWLYLWEVLLLAMISYGAGILLYMFGRFVQHTAFFQRFLRPLYKRQLRQLKRFGGLLILLAALTPISFTVVCFLVGATGFSFRHFICYAATRYVRFIIYAYTFWHLPLPSPC